LVGILVGSLLATPVLAQADKNVCLQRNRILSWRPLNDTTILYTDKQRNTYTLTFRDSCAPLTQTGVVLIYASKAGSLACISKGDAISVKAGGRAGATCRVASVEAGPPDQTPDQAPDQAAPPG
jgi:hypothetical protein